MSSHLPPEAEKVLVVAPHADDETMVAGGTISIYVSKGAQVRVLVVSDGARVIQGGSDGDIVEIRRREALAAAEVLGIAETFFLGLPDGELADHEEEIARKLGDAVTEFCPDIIFVPSPLDAQSDHMAVSRAALRLMPQGKRLMFAFYEAYGTIRPNLLVDISATAEKKDRAIMHYRQSLLGKPEHFLDASEGLSRFWEFHTLQKGRYEAFWVVPGPPTLSEAITWLTYGAAGDCGAQGPSGLFSKLKAVDALLHELKECDAALGSKDSEIQELIHKLRESEDLARSLDAEAAGLKAAMKTMEGSIFWRTARLFYWLRDRLLPKTSRRRGLYDRVISSLKER